MPVHDEAFLDDGLVVTAWERVVAADGEADWREVGRMVAIVHGLPGVSRAPAAL